MLNHEGFQQDSSISKTRSLLQIKIFYTNVPQCFSCYNYKTECIEILLPAVCITFSFALKHDNFHSSLRCHLTDVSILAFGIHFNTKK